ncbi:MAG: hypothetical protein KJ737_15400 [Proteobacteria bacterium]|nr:hypothetical protein [Pseudomonadota bacterium]
MVLKSVKVLTCVCLLLVFTALNAFSTGEWELSIPLPAGDPLWNEVQILWDNHWDEKNIDDLIGTLNQLEKQNGDTPETCLWLARIYYLKARYHKKGRTENLKQSERYAAKAISIDDNNMAAMKLLITSVSSYADMAYIKNTYGPLFLTKLPVPIGRALPEMDHIPAFKEAMIDWDMREDIHKGKKAVAVFKKIADDNPKDLLAQLWVARGDYYLGFYHLSMGRYDVALPIFKEGNVYGLKALDLSPHSVPANYWRQLNLARSIQNENILVKARYLKPIMSHLVFTANENMTYLYCGPLISTATIIEKGGWVAEKGVGLAGYTVDTVMTGLELAVLAYPTYFYTHFAKAEMLYHLGRKEEAKELINRIIHMDPHQNPYHAPENICTQRLARLFLSEFFREK